jgi:hypothetical protein
MHNVITLLYEALVSTSHYNTSSSAEWDVVAAILSLSSR